MSQILNQIHFFFICAVKKIIPTALILASLISVSFAQKAEKFFDKKDLLLVGSYYYPEQWPEANWERDIKNMSGLGFEFTHFGEFAWSAMEPEEGKYDFEWLDKAVALAAKYKLKVVLCTPTPTPPAWLTEKHPDVLMVNAEGRTIQHGARQQASWSSKTYRAYVDKIVTVLAKRYGTNKAVWGWQIDNEPSHYGTSYDYSENAQQAYREWLKNKYKDIGTLNKVWGNAFWSQTYNNFEQIHIPNVLELVAQANPHAVLDFKRFTADEAAHFILLQQNILRKYIQPAQWVTTNLMPTYSPVDPLRMKDLDFLTYTKYLAEGYDMGHGEQGFRMGSANSIGFSNDFFRPINGVTGVMELQPGQVNWGLFNPQTMPGTVRMWIYHVMAGGNKFVCNYRFREPLSGGEQYHYGIMKTDGVTVSRSGDEYVKVIKELKDLRKAYQPETAIPSSLVKRKSAILYNPDSRWEMEYQPQSNQWDYMAHVNRYYKALKSLGAPVDVIDETKDFAAYPFLIAPAFQLLDHQLVSRWKTYVENGGNLVLTCRTGQKDREAHLWEALFQQPILDLIGAKEIYFDLLPVSLMGKINMGQTNYDWNNWGDVIDPISEADVWATYSDQFYKGKAAVLHRKLGKGTITYVGADTDNGQLEKTVLRKIFNQASVPTLSLPEGVLVEYSNGFWYGFNYSSQNQEIPIPTNAKILLGQKTIKPADVVIWKE
ncbi:beta-galactosidase [Arcticibacter eurypsychrophilus]|uniref:beta-galactosidase n=1 Tax=Arcticibacter eurypsychrophilus TaxID=1434752 RepID=UPI00084DEFBA|nr:beta-galactosidase [Arcticibacter eurypsychrophilus]